MIWPIEEAKFCIIIVHQVIKNHISIGYFGYACRRLLQLCYIYSPDSLVNVLATIFFQLIPFKIFLSKFSCQLGTIALFNGQTMIFK